VALLGDAQVRGMLRPLRGVREAFALMAAQALQGPLGQALLAHVPERFFVDSVVGVRGAEQRKEN
jgi:hypothetical protein